METRQRTQPVSNSVVGSASVCPAAPRRVIDCAAMRYLSARAGSADSGTHRYGVKAVPVPFGPGQDTANTDSTSPVSGGLSTDSM